MFKFRMEGFVMFNGKFQNTCQHCQYKDKCSSETRTIHQNQQLMKYVDKGQLLFAQGQAFDALYILCDGAAKATNVSSEGEHVIEFFYPGDVIGLSGFGQNQYSESVKLLKNSRVCRIDKDTADFFNDPILNEALIKTLTKSLTKRQHEAALNHQLESEERLYQFLKEQQRRSASSIDATIFTLSMPRMDIANYLGVAVETLSRLMANLNERGVISAKNREISIITDLETI